MGKVVAGFTMSLDGFIAGPNDEVDRIFGWYFGGDTPVQVADGMVFRLSPVSAEIFQESITSAGALVTGRRDFDVSRAWGGTSPLGVPTFIVTHTVPEEWAGEDSPFIFVTAGVASAIEQARAVAGDKNVAVGGSKITQQLLQAGLLDEIHIELVPILLGEGIRLFESLGTEPIELESLRVIEAPGVTHLKFRIVK